MARRYRINPFCPHCGEQHCYWDITLTGEEQKALDEYYEAKDAHNKTSVANLIEDVAAKPLTIKRELICGACHQDFKATITVYQEDEIGYGSQDIVPMGEYEV